MQENHTIAINSSDLARLAPADPAPGERAEGDLTQELMATNAWTDQLVAAAGIPVVDVPLVTIGGGIGSFALFDILRMAGKSTSDIAVLTNIDQPWQTYEYLTKVSQIPRPEVLRSDAGGMPENPWGFPSFALRYAWKHKSIAPLFSVAVEPIFTDYWTPPAGQVFEAMERESSRIGFARSVVKGNVRMVRKRIGGGYFTILTPPPGTSRTKRIAYRSQYVHIAVGYPGLRFLPDLQAYRTKHQDYTRVVNAYEPHENVYETLLSRGGTVMVRGGGIVASRILQRLMEDRMNKGAQTQILHVFRTFVAGTHGEGIFWRRKGGGGFAYQGFNWPKATWGGTLKHKLEKLEGEERAKLYRRMGGTHTPKRKLWQQQKERAAREGWYHTMQGEMEDAAPTDSGRIHTMIKSQAGTITQAEVDFIIDATGLEGDLRDHRLMADLLDHSGAGRNPLGRLDVERSFEIRGTRNEPGRMYASGSMTLGGYYAGVDSFLGLTYASLQMCDDLARLGFCKRVGVGRSMSQWWMWARNRALA